MKIVFFGPPGSGKGTQAKLIAEKVNIFHLSTGEILRDKLKDQDQLSTQLKDTMSSGNLVSDDLLNQIITEKLTSKDCNKGFILDGYPRTIPQSDFLLSFLNSKNLILNFVFYFKIDFNIVEERIMKRFKQEKRTDDNLNVIDTRLEKYKLETFPVSKVFSDKFPSNYFTIDATEEISKIQKELIKIIKKGEK